MATNIAINDLNNLPHRDGQIVLEATRDDFEVVVRFCRGVYHIWGVACCNGAAQFTRLAAERATPKQARDLAARLWREGEAFNTIRP